KTGGGWSVVGLAKKLEKQEAFPPIGFWPNVDLSIKAGCASNAPMYGAMAQFPSATVEGRYQLSSPDPIPDLKDLRDDRAIILVTGCLTYSTFDKPHHTGFCEYVSKVRTGAWEFNYCPGGNFAE